MFYFIILSKNYKIYIIFFLKETVLVKIVETQYITKECLLILPYRCTNRNYWQWIYSLSIVDNFQVGFSIFLIFRWFWLWWNVMHAGHSYRCSMLLISKNSLTLLPLRMWYVRHPSKETLYLKQRFLCQFQFWDWPTMASMDGISIETKRQQ